MQRVGLVDDIAVEGVNSSPERYSYIGIKHLACDGDRNHSIGQRPDGKLAADRYCCYE